MTDTHFTGFDLCARRGIGNVRSLLFTIADELPVDTVIQDDTLYVPNFEAGNDLMKEIIDRYGSQLRDTGPNLADTENCGYWFWRIKDGKYQQTDGSIVPNLTSWNDGTEPVQFQPETDQAAAHLSEAMEILGNMADFVQAVLKGTIKEDQVHYWLGLARVMDLKVNGLYGEVQCRALAVIGGFDHQAISFSQEMANELVKAGHIWLCPDCQMYHPAMNITWNTLMIEMHQIKDRLDAASR